jgi:hypothetical protein
MKTEFFSKTDVNEGFRRDVKVLASLPDAVLSKLPEFANSSLLVPTTAEREKVHENASRALGVPRAQLDHALDVSAYLLRNMAPEGDAAEDDPASVVEDLKELLQVADSRTSALVSLFRDLKRLAAEPSFRLSLLKRAHAVSTLPTLDGVSVDVDFRAVFDKSYNYAEDVASHAPKFLGTIPLGIIRLTVGAEETQEVFFQVSARGIQVLIDHLLALQKEMKIAEQQLAVERRNP